MQKHFARIKLFGFSVAALALAVAAHFGYRCPAQGCPACKMLGH